VSLSIEDFSFLLEDLFADFDVLRVSLIIEASPTGRTFVQSGSNGLRKGFIPQRVNVVIAFVSLWSNPLLVYFILGRAKVRVQGWLAVGCHGFLARGWHLPLWDPLLVLRLVPLLLFFHLSHQFGVLLSIGSPLRMLTDVIIVNGTSFDHLACGARNLSLGDFFPARLIVAILGTVEAF